MDTSVKKEALLEILKKNRANHHKVFVKAVAKYRDQLLEQLEEHVKRIRTQKGAIRVYISLPVPEEHLSDYDRAIRMVELDTRPEILLTEKDAAHFIEDCWEWEHSFLSNTTSYLATEDEA